VRDYFTYFVHLVRSNHKLEAKRLFHHLNEPNETCLGLSRGAPSGRGIGSGDAEKMFQSLLKSKAVRTGIVDHVEDCRVFIEGIDKDKTSDMTTNIIRKHLISYTESQCRLWGIPMTPSVPTGFFWDRASLQWINEYQKMLVVDNRKILLIPKAIASYSDRYTPQKYYQHFVLNFLQHEHLRIDSALVQKTHRKNGTVRRYVTKKSLKESVAPYSKAFLESFTAEHPEVFKEFRISTENSVYSLRNEELTSDNRQQVCQRLSDELQSILPGRENATRYHRAAAAMLEFIFYPNLVNPTVEREIHDGRKRIDITFDNCADSGFFNRLLNICGIPCPFIMIECKNYSRDINNPELDQITGRFSPTRGKFGLITCRTAEDMNVLLQRCSDTYHDDRGLVIPLVDGDLIRLLEQISEGHDSPEEAFLSERYRQIGLT